MAQSLAQLFSERVESSGSRTALRYKENKAPYRDMSWSDLHAIVENMAFGLAALGFQADEKAAVMAPTSHHWITADLAIICAGGVSVPIYPTSSSSDIEHILNNSESSVAFVYNESLLNRVIAVKDRVPHLKKIVLMTAPSKGKSLSELGHDPAVVLGIEELLDAGRELKSEQPQIVGERCAGLTRGRLATIIYTSGTTGTPKGVMLTHHNILSVLEDLPQVLIVGNGDTFLSFLPLSHVFERICGEYYWIYSGCCCAFAEGIEYVAKNMSEVQPTHMLVVPRILDKIYAKVKAGIEGASGKARRLIEWSVEVGRQVQHHRNTGRELRQMLKAKFWLAEKLVLRKLRDRIGSNLKLIVSGGAPASPEVVEFFNAIGITVLEGYGLTETSAPTNVNRFGKNKFGTVGPKLKSVEMKIAEDGEICFRGPSIFSGYYKANELTSEVFNEDWFHTGDIGHIDSDGYLKITDRKKDIIVNSAGKNIAPQKIENIIRTIPVVSQSVVFGDKRKTLVALLTLDEQATVELAREKNWSFNEYSDLVANPELLKHIKDEITKRSRTLADYERVFNFAVLSEELSVEKGELTATLKIKRSVLKQKYRDLIESLYKEEPALSSAR